MRTLVLATALLFAVPAAIACPLADPAEYAAAVERFNAAEGTKVTLTVTGMSCGSCSAKVAEALEAIDGVKAAAIDFKTGKTQVAYDGAKTDVEALTAAITRLGYAIALKDEAA